MSRDSCAEAARCLRVLLHERLRARTQEHTIYMESMLAHMTRFKAAWEVSSAGSVVVPTHCALAGLVLLIRKPLPETQHPSGSLIGSSPVSGRGKRRHTRAKCKHELSFVLVWLLGFDSVITEEFPAVVGNSVHSQASSNTPLASRHHLQMEHQQPQATPPTRRRTRRRWRRGGA